MKSTLVTEGPQKLLFLLNFDLMKNQPLENAKIFPKLQIRDFEIVKITFFETQKFAKSDFTENMNSRKILEFPHCAI